MKRLEEIAGKFLAVTGTLLFLVLTGYSLFYTEYFESNHADMPLEMQDNWKAVLLLLLLIVTILGIISKFSLWGGKTERSLPIGF